MYRGYRVAVVMPAFNVEGRLPRAVASVPDFVDRVVVVDDGSVDGTDVAAGQRERPAVCLIRHERNRGVGAAITTGYHAALEQGAQLVAVMAGDGQMDPDDLPSLLDPLVEGRADYAKGNRFQHHDVWRQMPPARLAGNVVLSLVTKLTAGYPHVFDSQCGYTAISREALRLLDGALYSRYGYPNDLLARLRTIGARVVDVPVRPVYEGQDSGIRVWTVLHPIPFVLARSLVRRLWRQRLRPLLGGGAEPRRQLQPSPEPVDEDRRPEQLVPAPPR